MCSRSALFCSKMLICLLTVLLLPAICVGQEEDTTFSPEDIEFFYSDPEVIMQAQIAALEREGPDYIPPDFTLNNYNLVVVLALLLFLFLIVIVLMLVLTWLCCIRAQNRVILHLTNV